MPLRTVQSWALGESPIPPTAAALMRLLEGGRICKKG